MTWRDLVLWLFPLNEGHHVTSLSIYARNDLEEERRFRELELRIERVGRAIEEFKLSETGLDPKYDGRMEPRKT